MAVACSCPADMYFISMLLLWKILTFILELCIPDTSHLVKCSPVFRTASMYSKFTLPTCHYISINCNNHRILQTSCNLKCSSLTSLLKILNKTQSLILPKLPVFIIAAAKNQAIITNSDGMITPACNLLKTDAWLKQHWLRWKYNRMI